MISGYYKQGFPICISSDQLDAADATIKPRFTCTESRMGNLQGMKPSDIAVVPCTELSALSMSCVMLFCGRRLCTAAAWQASAGGEVVAQRQNYGLELPHGGRH